MTQDLLSFRVPPGIGDISWVYSKLAGLGRPLRIEVADSGPRRALPYLELLPLVKESCYVQAPNPAKIVAVPAICQAGKALPTWSAEQLVRAASEEVVPIDLNGWLEAGNRIEDFMPEIPTVHHYEMQLPPGPPMIGDGAAPIELFWRRFVCFYCANQDTVRRWHGWEPRQWGALARLLMDQCDLDGVALVGATWDRSFAERVFAALDFTAVLDLVGHFSLADTLRAIRRSLYLVAFPSGIPILATVMSRPTVMFYPDSLRGLMTSWAPPDVLEDGTYKAMPFCEPEAVFDWIKEKLHV